MSGQLIGPIGVLPAATGGGFTYAGSLTGWTALWDASVTASISLSGATILSIADQSGGGNTATNNGGDPTPTYNATGFNGLPAMMFNGTTQYLTCGSFPMGTGNTLTAWAVGSMNTGASAFARLIGYGAPGNVDFNNVGSWAITRDSSNDAITVIRNLVSPAGTAIVSDSNHRFIFTIDSSGAMTLWLDGISVGTATSGGNWTSAGVFEIGNPPAGTNFWKGSIAECGVATGFSNSTLVGQFDTFLKSKWGL